MHWGLKMMNDKNTMDQELEALFERARMAPPKVPDGLMERVLLDAESLQDTPSTGWLVRVFAALGGAPGMGGLITATCVGFWLGVAPPDGLPDLAGSLLGMDEIVVADAGGDGIYGFGWDIEEGERDG